MATPEVVGVLMLDTHFERLPGDVGHDASFRVRVHRRIVAKAWPSAVVASAPALRAAGLLPAFQQAAGQLCDAGATRLTTSCGFLVLLQSELQAAVPVPLATSALLLLPGLLEREPRVGVLTISAAALGREHLLAAGVPAARLPDVWVEGVDPAGEFASAILGDRPQRDHARAAAELVAAARRLHARAPRLSTLVLECTNMPPHAADIERATGWRVLSLLDHPVLAGCAAGRAA